VFDHHFCNTCKTHSVSLLHTNIQILINPQKHLRQKEVLYKKVLKMSFDNLLLNNVDICIRLYGFNACFIESLYQRHSSGNPRASDASMNDASYFFPSTGYEWSRSEIESIGSWV